MRDWEKVLLAPSTSIIRGMEVIDNSSLQVALIVNDDKRLLGTVTDGDIRRGILRGVLLDEPIHKIMHTNPTVAHLGACLNTRPLTGPAQSPIQGKKLVPKVIISPASTIYCA